METTVKEISINGSKTKGKRNILEGTLFDIENKYATIKIIGQGRFGVVCSAINTEKWDYAAIKKNTIPFEKNSNIAVQTLREIKILRHLKNHEFIVELKDIMIPALTYGSEKKITFKDVYMVFELMDENLHQIIHSDKLQHNERLCQIYIAQLLLGLVQIHSAKILHRDLKPGNLLIKKDLTLKICDFGLSHVMITQSEQMLANYVGTRHYRAPELLLGCVNYDTSVDMWSVGCIFAELVFRDILNQKPIFPGKSTVDQLKLIISMLGIPDDIEFIGNENGKELVKSFQHLATPVPFSVNFPNANLLAVDLLEKMLKFDPRKRISVKEALRHPYIQEIINSDDDLKKCFDYIDANQIEELVDDVDEEGLDDEMIRDLIWKEMLDFHRDRKEDDVDVKVGGYCCLL